MKRQKELKCLLGPVATRFDSMSVGNWKNVKPNINNEKCILCKQCIQYCPTGVISMDSDNENKVFIDYNYCKGCGICSKICNKNCILMVKNE